MPKRTTSYRTRLLEDLRDPAEATDYINAGWEDSEEAFFGALRDIAEARQMAKIAGIAGVSREALYRMLRPTGNPTSRNLFGILRALDLQFNGLRPR